ncbi:MAG TPA: sterol desaturase family protein [Gemmataceae bacterium]|nr:sterol desaturase family protein [Gemmataceae bacterium]
MTEAAQIVITFLGMAVLCVLLERVWPLEAGQNWRSDSFTDVLYLGLRIALSAGLALGTGFAGATLPDHGPSLVGSFPFVTQLVLFLFLSDFVQYWAHRLMHRLTPLWHVHAVHHSPDQVDWLVASRVHPFELAFNKAVSALPLYLIGFSPTVIAVAIPLAACYSLLLHANLRWTYGPVGYLIASPAFHRWHHAADRDARDKNFAQAFSVIDYLFGTAHFPRGRRPERYGLVGATMPRGIWEQFLYPIRVWYRPRPASGVAASARTPAAAVSGGAAVAPAPTHSPRGAANG